MLSPRKNTRSGARRRRSICAATASCPCAPHSENPWPYPESARNTRRTSPFCARSGGQPRATSGASAAAAGAAPRAVRSAARHTAVVVEDRERIGSKPPHQTERQPGSLEDVLRVHVHPYRAVEELRQERDAERRHRPPAGVGEHRGGDGVGTDE